MNQALRVTMFADAYEDYVVAGAHALGARCDLTVFHPDQWAGIERLVPAADPAALATSIIRLLRDPACATAVGTANRAIIADRFSTDVVHPMFDAVYTALVTR